jgi:ABC-type multidrug transport system ATPase subunit
MATTTRSRVAPAATLERLWKRYPDGTVALADISLVVGAGEQVLVTGPAGSGTSTLLRILSGRSLPSGGSARILGVAAHLADHASLRRLRRKVALLDGTVHVPPAATVGETMDIAAGTAERRAASPLGALDLVGGPEPARRVGDLDGVERAVLALALVAVRRPKLIVADDPWRDLDPGQGLLIGRMACRIADEMGAAFVLSGRDAGAFDGIDRAIRLRAGRVVARS